MGGYDCLLNCLFLKKQLAQYGKSLASRSLQARRSALKSCVGNELVTLSRSSRGSLTSCGVWGTAILMWATVCVWCATARMLFAMAARK